MATPAKSTTVYVFTKKDCYYCDALKRVLLPVMDGVMSDADSPMRTAGIRMRVVSAEAAGDVDPAIRAKVHGFPSIVFVQDGVVVPRHTISGFPGEDQDTVAQFGEWFGRYVAAAHFRDV